MESLFIGTTILTKNELFTITSFYLIIISFSFNVIVKKCHFDTIVRWVHDFGLLSEIWNLWAISYGSYYTDTNKKP
jgi:hypothetical protein